MAEQFVLSVPTGVVTYTRLQMGISSDNSWELRGQTISPDGLSAGADYVALVGDPEYPTTAHVRINIDPEKAGTVQQVHFSIRLRSYVTHVETSTDPDTVLGIYPHDAVIAWNIPRPLLKDVGAIESIIQHVFYLAFQAPQQAVAADAAAIESQNLGQLSFMSPTIL